MKSVLPKCLVLFFLVSCSTPGSWGLDQSDPLCNRMENQLGSSFMLSGDTFFQFDRMLYIMNSTKFTTATKLKGYNNQYHADSAKRVRNMETEIQDNTLIEPNFPIWAFDYQYNYNDSCNDTFDEINWCHKHSFDSEYSYVCMYGIKRGSADQTKNIRIAAALSYNGTNLMKIQKPELEKEVQPFCERQMKFLFNEFRGFHNCDNSSFIGWSYTENINYTKITLKQYYVCILHHEDKWPWDIVVPLEFNITPDDSTVSEPHRDLRLPEGQYGWNEQIYKKSKQIDIDRGENHAVIPIMFRSNIQILFQCQPNKCKIKDQLDTNMIGWSSKNPKTGKEFDIEMKGMTIDKILRCPHFIYEQDEKIHYAPLNFCQQKSFISIFSLGDDIYFQGNGKFWRYYALSSTGDAIKNSSFRIMNIRYDSYTTTLLDKFFDLSQPVVGFTLNVPKGCDKYDSVHKFNCTVPKDHRYKLYLTCLYGWTKNEVLQSSKYLDLPFINTPSGIEPYPDIGSPEYIDQSWRCKDLASNTWRNSEDRPGDRVPVAIVNVYTELHDPTWDRENGHLWIQHRFLYYYRTIFEGSSGKGSQNWFAYFTNLDKKAPDHYHKSEQFKNIEYTGNIPGIFYFKPRDLWIIFWTSGHGKIPQINGTMTSTATISWFLDIVEWPARNVYKLNITYITHENHNYTVQKHMNCSRFLEPQSYSMVEIQNTYKWICWPALTPEYRIAFSAFNIGEYFYVQTLHRFYRYIDTIDEVHGYKEGFAFDKQVSELLNDIFDTNERVIGFSYPYMPYSAHKSDKPKYRVILFGKPKLTYLIRANLTYRVFEKEVGLLPPLVPVNKMPDVIALMNYPFGPVEHFCIQTDLLRKCEPGISFHKSKDHITLDAVAFMDGPNLPDRYKTHNESHLRYGALYPKFFAAISNTTNFYVSTEGEQLFSQPIRLFKKDLQNKTRAPFTRIYGMFVFQANLYILATSVKESVPEMYTASVSRDLKPNEDLDPNLLFAYDPISWDDILTHSMGTLDRALKCDPLFPLPSIPKRNRSHLWSVFGISFDPLVVIFLTLLLLFIIVFIMIGVMEFKRYQSNKKKTQQKDDNKSDSDSNPNQSSTQ